MTEFLRASIKSDAFKESFGPFDILWAVLALGSAFGIGRGDDGVPAIFAFLSVWFATPQGPCTP